MLSVVVNGDCSVRTKVPCILFSRSMSKFLAHRNDPTVAMTTLKRIYTWTWNNFSLLS